MSGTWCAGCGAYVEHDPSDTHHIALDAPSDGRSRTRLTNLIGALLRRLTVPLSQNVRTPSSIAR